MSSRVKVRRARRGDFARVRALLGASGPAALAELKRFRRLVSTLREDLYVAEREGEPILAGLAVVVYARGLGPPTAVVRSLCCASDAIAEMLLEWARARASARGCTRLELQLEAGGAAPASLATSLVGAGWHEGPRTLVRTLDT